MIIWVTLNYAVRVIRKTQGRRTRVCWLDTHYDLVRERLLRCSFHTLGLQAGNEGPRGGLPSSSPDGGPHSLNLDLVLAFG